MHYRLSCVALAAVLACVSCGDDKSTSTDASTTDLTDSDVNDIQDLTNDVVDGPDSETPDAVDATDVPVDMALSDYPPVVDEAGAHLVELVSTRQMIPGPGLPMNTPPGNANNNLDIVRHDDGRVYLAWRTAPNHFAGAETRIHVVSSADEVTWDHEATFQSLNDLREPRLLSLPTGALFLYLAELGDDPAGFEPQNMLLSERLVDGTWTPTEVFYRPGFIPWRTKVERGTAYMTAYVGGEHIYNFDGIPLEVELLTTTDGRNWQGVDPMDPVVSTGGGSETAFTVGDDGDMYAVIRNEAGDWPTHEFGSKICSAPASDISDWTCSHDPRKYDSPYMFWYDGEVYLIGRRNLTVDGLFDLGTIDDDPAAAGALYNLDYRGKRKRCALWRMDPLTRSIGYILDLPSRGDTCFPGVMAGSGQGEFVVYNYSSPIDGPDVVWSEGQAGPTNIYRHELRFTAR